MRSLFRLGVVVVLLLTVVPAAALAQQDGTDVSPCDGAPDAGFDDAAAGGVHTDGINCIVAYGIAQGSDADTFAAASPLLRGQAATMLLGFLRVASDDAILDGVDPDAPVPFEDIDDSVHAESIRTLSRLALVSGTGTTTFAPGLPVQRGQFASLVYAAHQALEATPPDAGPSGFEDTEGSIHASAIDALAALGIVRGLTPTTFGPDQDVTRGQAATMLVLLADVLAGEGRWEAPLLVPPAPDDDDEADEPDAPADTDDGAPGPLLAPTITEVRVVDTGTVAAGGVVYAGSKGAGPLLTPLIDVQGRVAVTATTPSVLGNNIRVSIEPAAGDRQPLDVAVDVLDATHRWVDIVVYADAILLGGLKIDPVGTITVGQVVAAINGDTAARRWITASVVGDPDAIVRSDDTQLQGGASDLSVEVRFGQTMAGNVAIADNHVVTDSQPTTVVPDLLTPSDDGRSVTLSFLDVDNTIEIPRWLVVRDVTNVFDRPLSPNPSDEWALWPEAVMVEAR